MKCIGWEEATNSIQLIDEDHAGGAFTGLSEEVADARGAAANKQLHKLGGCRRQEGDARLARHCLGCRGNMEWGSPLSIVLAFRLCR